MDEAALVLMLEKRLMDPVERRDPSRLAHLLDEDFVEHGQSGRTFTKAQVLAVLPVAPAKTLEVNDFRLREIGPGLFLAVIPALRGRVLLIPASFGAEMTCERST